MSNHDLLISCQCPLDSTNEREVGGKGWNLFRLAHFGFPVPPWIIISSRLFDDLLSARRRTIEDLVAQTDYSSGGKLAATSKAISAIIHEVCVPNQFAAELSLLMEETFGPATSVSVRSSVVGEDSQNHSFAGLMDSYLNKAFEDVIQSVKKVWASAYSTRALIYRQRKNIGFAGISTAVIVQKMVQSKVSGILFTRDPETRHKQVVITAGFGLGDEVVNNRAETGNYRVDWNKHYENNHQDPSTQTILNEKQIDKLCEVGREAEKSFELPQDIEWTIDFHGELFILQARPIVFGTAKHASQPLRIWDNSNIVESYPGLTLPLTFSFVRVGYENAFRNLAASFLRSPGKVGENDHVFKNLIGLLDGRIYYNLLHWYSMLSFLPGFKRHKDSWDQMIGISRKIPFPVAGLSMGTHLVSLGKVIWRLLTVRKNAEKFNDYFETIYDRYRDVDLSAGDEQELIAMYEALQSDLMPRWHLTLYNDFCAMKYYDWLKQLCDRWGPQGNAHLHNHLLCGEKGVESVKPIHALIRLAELVRSDPNYLKLFTHSRNTDVWQTIQTDPHFRELKTNLEKYLDAYGDRGLEELKLEVETFRERPELLVKLIKDHVSLELSVEGMREKEQKIRTESEQTVLRDLRNPFKQCVFRWVLANARRAIAARENMRFARSRAYGIVRRIFKRLGDWLTEKNLLACSSDIYYLTTDEVIGFVQGTAVTQDLQALVDLRKKEYAEFARRNADDRIETHGIPYLGSFSSGKKENGCAKTLKGIGCSGGLARGKAKIVLDPNSVKDIRGQILVAHSTDPGWVFLMISSQGIVVERGSVLSHTAIIGRELGIPTIVGVKDATTLTPDGETVLINGSTGVILWQ